MQVIGLKYLSQYQAAFPGGGNIEVNVGKAFAAYERALVTTDAPIDRYALGDRDALSPAQKHGLKVFLGRAGCIGCHRGPMLTDNLFHSVGIGQTGPNVLAVDHGLFGGLQDRQACDLAPDKRAQPAAWMDGLFRTKSLREIARTGPYFHAGQLRTLADVVEYYNRGGDHDGAHAPDAVIVPLGLTDAEKQDLVAFLSALSGHDPDARWTANVTSP
jgi:cytochrome c peroxidase